ncbi:hypothetical protein XENTR_v10017380 [Xenopus tropicalis]|nr:hypothetical protein XENTR_v10017380 [Xenopus tropicalis]KAE8599881.1 hypothetical protein XENTR_v10017380 [Xenopus tropicalis]KAE8599882.1 hypothetical protein XENTR_v10017380 [Xenopus tropicalis]
MKSLVFVCAQKVVSDHSSLRRALDFMPKELYPALFQAAFLGKKTLVLQDLVQTWPFAVLSFQKLLNSDRHCDPVGAMEKPSKLCVQTIILGVITYLSDALAKGPEGQRAGGLQRPLESLELAFCSLLPMDLSYLSQSVHVSSLRKLDLSGNNLSDLLLTPFLQVLSEVSGRLLYLDVMECKLKDAHLGTLMTILRRCSHLRYLGLFCNPISSDGLRMVLQNLVQLAELRLVVYPFPVDCYSDATQFASSAALLDSSFDHDKLARVGEELQQMLLGAQRADMVWTTDMYVHRTLDSLSL